MLSNRKVVWSEGMFLRPQHFQQQERHVQRRLALRTGLMQPFGWGFAAMAIEREALALGTVVVSEARGVFADGTAFAFPQDDDPPAALQVPAEARGSLVVLALPRQRDGRLEVTYDEGDAGLARYATVEAEVTDSTPGGLEPALLQLGSLKLRLAFDHELDGDWIKLGVARVLERRADNRVVLDDTYIPPWLACGENEQLSAFTREVAGLLDARGAALVGRLSDPARAGAAEIADLLLLEVINRHTGSAWHAGQIAGLHPERLFQEWLALACALATYTTAGRRPQVLPEYRHDDLGATFHPLMAELRRSLSIVLRQTAIQIPLEDRGQGVRVAQISDAELLQTAGFVLAVNADMATEALRSHFPAQVKIGPVERIRDLVHLQLPGVTVRALPVAPRQLPYRAGQVYFELDKTGDFWRQLEKTGSLALHVSGEFPRLAMEFWALRD